MASKNSTDYLQCQQYDFKTGKIRCPTCARPETYRHKSRFWCKIKNPNGDGADILDTYYPYSPYRKATSILTPNPFYVAKKKCECPNSIKKNVSLIIVDNVLYDEILKEKMEKKAKKKNAQNFNWYSFVLDENKRRKQTMKINNEQNILKSYSQKRNSKNIYKSVQLDRSTEPEIVPLNTDEKNQHVKSQEPIAIYRNNLYKNQSYQDAIPLTIEDSEQDNNVIEIRSNSEQDNNVIEIGSNMTFNVKSEIPFNENQSYHGISCCCQKCNKNTKQKRSKWSFSVQTEDPLNGNESYNSASRNKKIKEMQTQYNSNFSIKGEDPLNELKSYHRVSCCCKKCNKKEKQKRNKSICTCEPISTFDVNSENPLNEKQSLHGVSCCCKKCNKKKKQNERKPNISFSVKREDPLSQEQSYQSEFVSCCCKKCNKKKNKSESKPNSTFPVKSEDRSNEKQNYYQMGSGSCCCKKCNKKKKEKRSKSVCKCKSNGIFAMKLEDPSNRNQSHQVTNINEKSEKSTIIKDNHQEQDKVTNINQQEKDTIKNGSYQDLYTEHNFKLTSNSKYCCCKKKSNWWSPSWIKKSQNKACQCIDFPMSSLPLIQVDTYAGDENKDAKKKESLSQTDKSDFVSSNQKQNTESSTLSFLRIKIRFQIFMIQ